MTALDLTRATRHELVDERLTLAAMGLPPLADDDAPTPDEEVRP